MAVTLVHMIISKVETEFLQSQVGIHAHQRITAHLLFRGVVLKDKLPGQRVVVGSLIFREELHVAAKLHFQHLCQHEVEIGVGINREGGERKRFLFG